MAENKSGRRGSNSPPIAWKAIALPNELLPLKQFENIKSLNLKILTVLFSSKNYFTIQLSNFHIDQFSNFLVGRVGFEPTYTYVNRFTVCRL